MTDPFDKLREEAYEDATNAALTMTEALLGYANLIERQSSLDAKEIEEVVRWLKSAARTIDRLSNVISTKIKRADP